MPQTLRYTSYFIPAAYQVAANVVMALVEGDDPSVAKAFGVAAVPNPGPADATATYFYGGKPTNDAWLATIAALDNAMPTPTNGWPVIGVGSVSVTEAEATAATAQFFMKTTTTMSGNAPDPADSLSEGMIALGLQTQMIGDGGL